MTYTFTGNTAMKKCKEINTEIRNITSKEYNECTYSYIEGETPVIPDYNFSNAQTNLTRHYDNLVKLKNAIRKFNLEKKGPSTGLTLDEILVYLPLYTTRKSQVDRMRLMNPHTRTTRNTVSEHTEINFDVNDLQKMYDFYNERIVAMQEDLNFINATETFKVDLIDADD